MTNSDGDEAGENSFEMTKQYIDFVEDENEKLTKELSAGVKELS